MANQLPRLSRTVIISPQYCGMNHVLRSKLVKLILLPNYLNFVGLLNEIIYLKTRVVFWYVP